MRISYEFIPAGSVATSEQCRVFLDVGNIEAPFVFDHHYPGSTALSTASLVLDRAAELTALAEICDDVVFVTHENPDLDAIVSSWIASKILSGDSPRAE